MISLWTALQESALLQYYVAAIFCLWPAARSLGRMGLPRGAAALLGVPLAGFALLMVFAALKKWPRLPPQPARAKREEEA